MSLADEVLNCSADSMVLMKDVNDVLSSVRKFVDNNAYEQAIFLSTRLSYVEKKLLSHKGYMQDLIARITKSDNFKDGDVAISNIKLQITFVDKDLRYTVELKNAVDEMRRRLNN